MACRIAPIMTRGRLIETVGRAPLTLSPIKHDAGSCPGVIPEHIFGGVYLTSGDGIGTWFAV